MGYSFDGAGEPARSTFAADKVVLDGNAYVIMFGGFSGKPLDDVLLYDQNSETFASPKCTVKPGSSVISARYSHTATVWNQKLVVFGGWSGSRCNDLYVLDCLTWEWEEIRPQGSIPSGRAGHTATLFGDHLVVFGGNDGELQNDVWILCLKSMRWHKTGSGGLPISGKPPHPVSSHSATKFSDQFGEFILFFGQKHEDNSIMYSHTHMLRLDIRYDGPQSEAVFNIRWESKETSGNKPGMRYSHSACKFRQILIVFGGVAIALRNDVWMLDTESWTWHRPTIIGKSPLARFGHCCWLSDVRPGQVMIFGGKHRSDMLSDLHSIEFSSSVNLDKVLNQVQATIDSFMQSELSELDKCKRDLKDQVDVACDVVEKALRHRQTKFSEDLNLIYLPMLRKSFHDAAIGLKEGIVSSKSHSCRIKLNIGGGMFETTVKTLCAVPGSLLCEYGERASLAASSASSPSSPSEGNDTVTFIDRSPRFFETVTRAIFCLKRLCLQFLLLCINSHRQILNYLRDTSEAIEPHLPQGSLDLQALLREAQYYRLTDLRHRITEVIPFALYFQSFILLFSLPSAFFYNLLCSWHRFVIAHHCAETVGKSLTRWPLLKWPCTRRSSSLQSLCMYASCC